MSFLRPNPFVPPGYGPVSRLSLREKCSRGSNLTEAILTSQLLRYGLNLAADPQQVTAQNLAAVLSGIGAFQQGPRNLR
ncbi:MAG: hypothetical protein WAN87_06250 [Thermoplasmata archaeon]